MNRDSEQDRSNPSGPRPEASSEGDPAAQGGGAPGTTDVQAYIGRQLRAVYDDVVKQPIPERFLALMAQLEGPAPSK